MPAPATPRLTGLAGLATGLECRREFRLFEGPRNALPELQRDVRQGPMGRNRIAPNKGVAFF